ncbi:hypothetical protein ACFX2G_044565 [Malus domestica]
MVHQMSPSNHDSNSDSSKARLYNPYQDLQVPMRNLYQLPTSPEFLLVEEAKHQHRSWGENLTFYTSYSYLIGVVGGGAADIFFRRSIVRVWRHHQAQDQ